MKVGIGTISYWPNHMLYELFQRSFASIQSSYPLHFLNVINLPVSAGQKQLLNANFNWVYENSRNNVSLAWNHMINQARGAGCNRLLITNSDIFYEPGSIDKLIAFSEAHPEIFITGTKPYDDPLYQVQAYPGDAVHYCSFMINLDRWGEWLEKDPYRGVEVLQDLVGYFNDTAFDPAYYEDIDFDRRVKLAGMDVQCCMDARIQHLVSQTIKLDPETALKMQTLYAICRQNYIELWGGDIGKEKFTKPYNIS